MPIIVTSEMFVSLCSKPPDSIDTKSNLTLKNDDEMRQDVLCFNYLDHFICPSYCESKGLNTSTERHALTQKQCNRSML